MELGVGGRRVRIHACAIDRSMSGTGMGVVRNLMDAEEETCNPSSTTTLKGRVVVAEFARLGRKISHPLFVDANVCVRGFDCGEV